MMTSHFSVTLPYPPTTNTYWRRAIVHGKPKTLISKKGRSYITDVKCAIVGLAPKLESRLNVCIDAYMPDKKRRDLDNILKALLDSMTHAGVWNDDSQIDILTVVRRGVEKPGRVVVTVTEI